MKTPFLRPGLFHPAAFTLVELLVAAAVSMMLVVALLAATQGITTNYSRTQANVTRLGDASMALDQIVQDLEGLVIPSFAGAEGLRVEPDPEVANSSWLTLLTTATDTDNSWSGSNPPEFTGAKRAVSYRVAFQNPLDAARTSDKAFALYRSLASARHTFENIDSGVTNLQSQYWNNLPASPAPKPWNPTEIDAFFAENIVGLRVRFQYLDSGGNPVWTQPGDTVRVGRDETTVNGNPVPGGLRRAEVEVLSISPEGAKRINNPLTPDEVIARFGRVTVRETSRF